MFLLIDRVNFLVLTEWEDTPESAEKKKQARHETLCQKTPFKPRSPYRIVLINHRTHTILLSDLIYLTRRTKHFSIDTESNVDDNRPALIQIEMIQSYSSTVLLFEVYHIPTDRSSLQFWYIRSLLKAILQSSNTFYAWGDGAAELRMFLSYGLFTVDMIEQLNMKNIQSSFKNWFVRSSRWYTSRRPIWGLQSAILELFDEYLDKRETLNIWRQDLSIFVDCDMFDKKCAMIDYAVKDCLAVTKIAITLDILKVSDFFHTSRLSCLHCSASYYSRSTNFRKKTFILSEINIFLIDLLS